MSGYFVVEGPPKVLTEDVAVHGNLGKPANLIVAFYSLPTFTSIQWFKQHQQASLLLESKNLEHTIVTRVDDLQSKFHGKEVTVPGYTTSVHYNNIAGGDFTSYTVVINNTKGSSVFTITLKGDTEPFSPHNLKEGEHTTTSVNISWTSGWNGGNAQTFLIEYKKTRDTMGILGPTVPQLSNADNEKYNSKITGLDPDTHYHVRVKTTNVRGQNTSHSIEVRTLEIEESGDVDSLSSVTGAVVGTVLALLVISVVVLLVLWRRGILPNPPCLKRKEPQNVYQNHAFSPESEHSRSETVYQDLGPTESDNLHYEPLASIQNSTQNGNQEYENLGVTEDASHYQQLRPTDKMEANADAEHQDSDNLYVNT
ncbi:hypothetical protein ScPMuIL_002450 [Solemya velum]